MVTGSTAILASADIQKTIDFYKEVLGFESSWTYGEPPTFGCASIGPVNIMFCFDPELAAHVHGHQHWISVDNADDLYAQHEKNGAKIVSEIEDKPWNQREYTVEDPSGYYLRFAGPLDPKISTSQPLPETVRLEQRLPTKEEYAKVAGQTFYREAIPPDVLANSWNGVVALTPDNEAIGMVRIMHDAPGWFSVWDVAVLPDWQAQGIGKRLMQEAIALIHDDSPGAFVFLFTFKHGFYERLGFNQDKVSMLKV